MKNKKFELDINFGKDIEQYIVLSKSLSDWFQKNQETL